MTTKIYPAALAAVAYCFAGTATAAPAPAPTAGRLASPERADVYSAIRFGDTVRLKRWISRGWNVNAALDERGNTPLHEAATAGNPETVRMLLAAGASPKAANSFGVTPLILGATDFRKAWALMEAGADVNAGGQMGRTALIVAASVPGNERTVKMLLARGAEWKMPDKFGINAAMAAANANQMETVRMLIERGADVSYVAPRGGGMLHWAAANGNVEMTRLILARGAPVDMRLSFEHDVRHGTVALGQITPLMIAVTVGPVSLVRMLLDAGADVNATDIRGMTPLMLAVATDAQDPAIVKLLLDRGALRDPRSKIGETAVDWAAKFNRPAIMEMLGAPAKPMTMAPAVAAEPVAAPASAEAVEKGMRLLERAQGDFFKQSGCVACHHGVTGAVAGKYARSHGGMQAGDPGAAASFRQAIMGQFQMAAPGLRMMMPPPGALDTVLYGLAGMDAADVEPNPVTDSLAMFVLRMNRQGSWKNDGIARPPMSEGNLQRTALALRALNRYLPPSMAADYAAIRRQSLVWVRNAPVNTTDDATMKLMALAALNAPASERQAARLALERLQNADGGWKAHPAMPASDAYSTGLAIFALAEAGQAASAPAYQRGAAWLLGTQQPDGSWRVASRTAKFQPYFDGGFPYGHDQWLSNAATSWAVAGLSMAGKQ